MPVIEIADERTVEPNVTPLRKTASLAALIALIWTLCCLVLAWRCGFPEPTIHDEFSYLLGADTLVRGRLANPPHPLRPFFESPHVLMYPKYASKYQPGQAMVLALGDKLFGSPWYGVLISGAAMMFLIAMTLGAWCSPAPAAAVSVVLGLVFLPPMYWVYSYWGGCLAAAGGAAVLLSFILYRRGHAVGSGALLACGAITLFLTRPYEGGVFTAAVVTAGAFRLYRERGRLALAGMRSLLLSAVPLALAGLIWTGIYDAAVTGNPFRLPYLLHDAQYDTVPIFWFLPLRPEPHYSHPRLAAQHGLHGWERINYDHVAKGRAFIHRPVDLCHTMLNLFGWTLLLLLLAPFAWRDWRIPWLVVVIGLLLLALGLETFHGVHYAAPMTAGMALLFACAAESSWRFRWHSRPVGAIITSVVFLAACAQPLLTAANTMRHGTDHHNTGDQRAAVIRRLSTLGPGQLVLVHYPSPDWKPYVEWVYNSADIDSQKVIFAHDLGTERNAALLDYYRGRQIWRVSVEVNQYRLAPYPSTGAGD